MPPLQLVDFCLRVFRKMSVFFWTIEDECYVGKFISLEKSRKGPVKLAFICTYVYYGGNKFSMLLYAFSQHYYPFLLILL